MLGLCKIHALEFCSVWYMSYMRAVPMCFSLLQVPRCRTHSLVKLWQESFNSLDRRCGRSFSFRLHRSKGYSLEGGYSKRWIRRPLSTKTEGRSQVTENSKSTVIRHENLDETVLTSATLNITKTEISGFQKIQYCDIQEKIAENADLSKLVTVIVFDIETTGFSRTNDRIIEIALQDLQGGENSTFQTLVNPGRYVSNSHVHRITTHMVCRPEVPRMQELIPILLQFVKSREKPGGYVVLVAHNARSFDVPFLIHEFSRCNVDIPSNWLFVDALPPAREFVKKMNLPCVPSESEGSKGSAHAASEGLSLPRSKGSGTSLEALRERLNIPVIGAAHRAMSDVITLSLILQRMTFDLKLPLSGLIQNHFRASNLTSVKKKNSRFLAEKKNRNKTKERN